MMTDTHGRAALDIAESLVLMLIESDVLSADRITGPLQITLIW
jgi:hypothetical protein